MRHAGLPIRLLSGRLVPGIPVRLFEGPYPDLVPNRSWDFGPDGRFLMIQGVSGDHPDLESWEYPTCIRLVQSWFEELKERVGTEE
jgi:hypothetical protein